MSVNISATFKADDRALNGLEAIEKDLIESPLDRHVVVGVVETVRITKDVADGMTETPTVRLIPHRTDALPSRREGRPEAARQGTQGPQRRRTTGRPVLQPRGRRRRLMARVHATKLESHELVDVDGYQLSDVEQLACRSGDG